MICTPDPVRLLKRGRARRWRGLTLLALASAMALQPGAGGAAPSAAAALVAEAHGDLSRGDGIAAEMRLRKAMAQGGSRLDVAAAMGTAYLAQGERGKAREWLGPGQFTPADAAMGFRSLAALERAEGKLAAAGKAYDRALALTPRDALLWVEIGRLRYAGGEHLLAIEAADHALALDPENVRALEFKGQIVRDQYGLAAALPWFQSALTHDPRDLSVLGEYAATLGDLGRASDMLKVTGQMLGIDGGNPRALYLRAVMAARAGDDSLARLLLNKAGKRLEDRPGALLLDGVLNLRTDNPALATKALAELVDRQPGNPRARMLLARALYAERNFSGLVARFADEARGADASPYLQTLVGRALEAMGDRSAAAYYLDRAASPPPGPLSAVATGSPIGWLIASRRYAEAEVRAEQWRRASPGSSASQAQAGDVQLALGRPAAALERYRLSSRVRMTDSLLARAYVANMAAGQPQAASLLVEGYLAQSPSSAVARRLAAGLAATAGNWSRASALLGSLRQPDGDDDPRLLAELAMAQGRAGDRKAALADARRAYDLQPQNAAATLALGYALAKAGEEPENARALLTKAEKLGGGGPVLAEARALLR